MATTFNWIYLGTTTTRIDPTEGNTTLENGALFNGTTWGSSGNPLYTHITSVTTINNGGVANALDNNNNVTNDQFTTDIGAGVQTFTYDGSVNYNITVTYADGTTGTMNAVVVQSTTGQLFLAPEISSNGDTTTQSLKPIVSIAITSINATSGNFVDSRLMTGWDDGYVEGTAGDDLINSAYVEPVANGSDQIDGGDGISGSATAWQDDRVRAGAGNDTVLSGLGNDSVDGGTGTDSIDGGDGNDTLYGGTGAFADTILGGLGNDSIDGDDGADSLSGGAGADTIIGGLGADTIDGGDGADSLNGGAGDDTFTLSGTFGNDTILGGETTETAGDTINAGTITANETLTFTGGEAGTLSDGTSTASFSQVERFLLGSGNDTVNGAAANLSMYVDAGSGADSMLGGSAADTLIGGTGADTLNGGAGADVLTGGLGSDTFTGITAGDVVDGSEDGLGTENDVLDLFGSGWTWSTTNIIYSDPGHENGTVEFLDANGNVIGTMTFSNIETIVPCFTPGTLIDTARGPVPVETLEVGDRVLTMDHGYQVLRWIGQRVLTPADLARSSQLRPILIGRDAFGPGLPERDLRVSPQHRLLLTGARAELISGETEVLAPAVHFLGLPGVVRDAAAAGVTYIHLLFDRHEIIRSDGLWTESYQPAAATLAGLDSEALTELFTLFPELPGPEAEGYASARSTVKRHEARLILAS